MKWCLVVFSLGVVLVIAEAQLLDDLDKPVPVTNVYGVTGHKVQLPCNIQPKRNDRVNMVLWFKDEGGAPIYTFDVRGNRQFNNADLWSSPRILGARAFFITATHPAHLSIDRLEIRDAGLYRCRVDYNDSPTELQHVHLNVIVPPEKPTIRIDEHGNVSRIEETYNEGSDVRFTCESRGGIPPPKLTWYHENSVIDETYYYDNRTGITINSLVFTKVQRKDYKTRLICQANNTNLTTPLTNLVILDINMKPLIVKIMTKDDKVSANKKSIIECRTWGSKPPAIITWWKENKEITVSVRHYQPENNQSTSILEFVPSIEDDGKYLTCRAENPSISKSIVEDKWRLDVQHQPVVNLRMGATLNPDGIKEGDDVYFECIVKANPRHYKLAWFKDNKEMKNNSTAGIVLSGDSLVLSGISRTAAGDYKCLAANNEGKTFSNTVKLQVMYIPVCKDGKNEITIGALKQETVSLICSVNSQPEPLTYQWTFNNSGESFEGQQQQQQSRYNQASGTSNILNSVDSLKDYQQYHGPILNYTPSTEMDYGTVACRAINQLGRQLTPCLFQIIAAGRPYPLYNCTSTEMSSNTIEYDDFISKSGSGLMVYCLDGYDGGLPIQYYQLEVVAKDDGSDIILNKTVQAIGNGPIFEITGLIPGRNYRLYIYAVNSKGRSEPTILEPVTLKGVAMYTTGNADEYVLSPLVLGLAATAILLVLAVAGILGALYRKNSSGGRSGSPKHSPIVCEPTNNGGTTPVHPASKQVIDDIDPDIIPNEYERRPLTYTPIFKTPPQRRRRDRDLNESALHEKKPMIETTIGIDQNSRLIDDSFSSTIHYPQNNIIHHNTYSQQPTMMDFKNLAMEAYNQRNHDNVYYSLQRSSKEQPSSNPSYQRPVSSSLSAHGRLHQPEVVTRSNRIQESCI